MTDTFKKKCQDLVDDLVFMRDHLVDEVDETTTFNYFARTIDKATSFIESVAEVLEKPK